MFQEGQSVPDMEIRVCDNSRQHLSDLWKESTLVLVFLRHLG